MVARAFCYFTSMHFDRIPSSIPSCNFFWPTIQCAMREIQNSFFLRLQKISPVVHNLFLFLLEMVRGNVSFWEQVLENAIFSV